MTGKPSRTEDADRRMKRRHGERRGDAVAPPFATRHHAAAAGAQIAAEQAGRSETAQNARRRTREERERGPGKKQ